MFRVAALSDLEVKKLLNQAYPLYYLNKPQEAIDILQPHVKKHVDIDAAMARYYLSLDDHASAIKLLTPYTAPSVRKNMSNMKEVLVFTMLVICYQEQKRLDVAEKLLNEITNQNHPHVQYAWVRFLQKKKDYAAAIKICKKIEKHFPSHINAFLSHAVSLVMDEQYQNALNVLKPLMDPNIRSMQFPKLYPHQLAVIYSAASICYREAGDAEKAMACAKFAIKVDANFAGAWTVLGKCYQLSSTQGAFQKARDCFNRAMALNPRRFKRKHPGTEVRAEQGNLSVSSSSSYEEDFFENEGVLAIARMVPDFTLAEFPHLVNNPEQSSVSEIKKHSETTLQNSCYKDALLNVPTKKVRADGWEGDAISNYPLPSRDNKEQSTTEAVVSHWEEWLKDETPSAPTMGNKLNVKLPVNHPKFSKPLSTTGSAFFKSTSLLNQPEDAVTMDHRNSSQRLKQ